MAAALLDSFLKDAGYAGRTFRRNPGFTALVVVSIAFGIAANTIVFSMVKATLLGALPVKEPVRLYTFSDGSSLSYPDYQDFAALTGVFEGVMAHFPLVPVSIGGAGAPERTWGQLVSGNYFQLLGLQPALGRGILPHEDVVEGRDAVVVLSHALWRRRFHSDPHIVGKAVKLNGLGYTVVGVAPRGFQGTDRGLAPEFWAPLAMYFRLLPELGNDKRTSRHNQWLEVTARLKRGVSREEAQAAANTVYARGQEEVRRKDQPRRTVTLTPAGGIPAARPFVMGLMAVLMVVVGLVLLIACANVANLLLARAAARQKEIGIRLSAGAGRGRLIRQLLTESLLLAVMGAAAGWALSMGATRAISRLELPLPVPVAFDFSPDLRVLAFTAGLSVLTGILFGLAPALRATRVDLVTALKDTGGALGGSRRFGLRNALVMTQVALSLVLLVGAGLFLRSLENASSIDIGFRTDNLLLMGVDPKLHGYSEEKSRRFFSELERRVAALPGVRSVSFVDVVPLSIGSSSTSYSAADGKDEKHTNADIFSVGSRYFETMGIPLRRGRDFTRGEGSAVVLINELMAQRLFGNQDPIGREIRGGSRAFQVIGIVGNSKSRTLGEAPRACVYRSMGGDASRASSFFGISLLVKTAAAPGGLFHAVRRQVEALDPDVAVFNSKTMQEHLSRALLIPRLCAALFGAFGVVGLALAGVGLYGMMSYSVRCRTREIGIRMALGARAGAVLRMVARQALALVAAGLLAGLAAAWALSRFIAGMLYGIDAADALTFTAVPLVLLAVALAAVLAPAARAARVDPNIALRYE
jgi:predicted permease